jgi:hypothetical protein
MSFSDDNNLEIPTSGVADWDSPLNGNFVALAQGFRFKALAGVAVNTGDAICVMSDGFVRPYDASSMAAPRPRGVSETALSSGEESQFFSWGVLRSMDVFSGNLAIGRDVFVDPASVGMLTSSYSAARYPLGLALSENAVLLRPDDLLPERVTQVVSIGPVIVGSAHAFEFDIGHSGQVGWLNAISGTTSMAYKLQFHSGSARVGSEELYETVTTSVDGGALDFDVDSSNYLDRSLWGYRNTDTASPGLIFGLITVQSVSATASGNFSFEIISERFS